MKQVRKTKAQASIEYLVIVGVAFAILTPMLYMFYDYTTSMRQEVGLARVYKIGGTMVNAAEQIYYLGEPSKTTLRVNMPANVNNLTTRGSNNDVLVFSFGEGIEAQDVVVPGTVPMIWSEDIAAYSAGLKTFRIESIGDHVEIILEE